MALESFYGGKPGISPIIKTKFKYISVSDPAYIRDKNKKTAIQLKPYTMEECFKDPTYKDVWYGEMCLIDTDSKMNPNNGKLFRRTLSISKYDSQNLHADYLGQIVGPINRAPNLDLSGLTAARKKAVNGESGWEYGYYKKDGSWAITKPTITSDIKVFSANENNAIDMVPGKTINSENKVVYNDKIQYTWCIVRKDEKDAWIYLGFKIPYTVFELKANTINFNENASVTDTSPSNHPFFKSYTFNIPRGTRGIGPEQVFIVDRNTNSENSHPEIDNLLYSFDAIQYNKNTDVYTVDTTKKINTSSISKKTYWVAKWSLYNAGTNEIETVYQYLGDYKDISDINLLNDGTLTLNYSDGTSKSLSNKIKWITDTTLDITRANNTYGTLTINYNDGNSFSEQIPFVQEVNLSQDGKLSVAYAGESTEEEIGNINTVKEFYIDFRGHLLALYNSSLYRPSDDIVGTVDGNFYYTYKWQGNYFSKEESWVKANPNGDNRVKTINNNTTNWWHDLGVVKPLGNPSIMKQIVYPIPQGQSGLSISNVTTQLKTDYPTGIVTTSDLQEAKGGYLVVDNVVVGQSTGSGIFYFDWDDKEWKYGGLISLDAALQSRYVFIKEGNTNYPTESETAPRIFFEIANEPTNPQVEPLSEFWTQVVS